MSKTTSEWKKTRLGELVEIRTGKKDANFGSVDGKYPFFTCARQVSHCKSFSFDCDAIMLAGNCDIGNMSRYNGKFEAYQRTYVLTNLDNQKSDIDFIWYFLKKDWVRITEAKMLGAAIKYIKLGMIQEFEIPLPPLPTQRRISDILSAYDDLIENNRRRIEILEETARTLYRKMFGGGAWPIKKLKDIADVNRLTYSQKGLPQEIDYIDISAVTRGSINGKTHYCAEDAPCRARRIAKDGDVIWSNVRPNLRAYALVLSPELNDVFSTGFSVVTAKSIPFTYLYLVLSDEGFVSYLDGRVTGSTYPAVRPFDFEEYCLPVPDEKLLEEFHAITLPMFRQRDKLAQLNTKLAEARHLLLPRLMSGKLEVSAAGEVA